MTDIDKTLSTANKISDVCTELKSIESRLEWIDEKQSFIINTTDLSFDNPFLRAVLNYERVKKEQELRELKKEL